MLPKNQAHSLIKAVKINKLAIFIVGVLKEPLFTGGLRVPMDFVKALALGADSADSVDISSAMQSIGCVAARMCHTNNFQAGIATQKADLRQRLKVEKVSV